MEEKKKTNVVAIIGFIFAILSVFTFGFVSIVGLILSIIGIIIAKKYSNSLKGLTIAGIIISSIMFIVFWVLVFIAASDNNYSTITPSTTPTTTASQSINVKKINVADFSTMTESEAKTWCKTVEANCYITSDYSDDIEAGKLISQSIMATTEIENTKSITIKYSLGHKKTPEEIAEEEKASYKESCQSYTYEEISRNPDNYKGLHAVFTGKVAQVMETSYSSTIVLRVNVTQGDYGWWDDTIYVTYTMPEGRARILDDDIITMYGDLDGLESYTAVLGNTITIPRLKAKYIE